MSIADQLILTVTVREDSALAITTLLDRPEQDGHADLVADAITLIAPHPPQAPDDLRQRIHRHLARRTRTIIDIPYEPALATGGRYYPQDHSKATRQAWHTVAAAVLDVPHLPDPLAPARP